MVPRILVVLQAPRVGPPRERALVQQREALMVALREVLRGLQPAVELVETLAALLVAGLVGILEVLRGR